MSDFSATDPDLVKSIIEEADTEVFQKGKKTTVMFAKLPNGFEVVVSSSCVDPDDYDESLGRKICRDRLKSKVWELLGAEAHDDLS